jgi:hypothetical protein
VGRGDTETATGKTVIFLSVKYVWVFYGIRVVPRPHSSLY